MNTFLRILGSSLAYTVIAQVVSVAVTIFSYKTLNDVQYAASLSARGQSLLTGFPSQDLLIYSTIGYFLCGILLSLLYRCVMMSKALSLWKKALMFGAATFLLAALDGYVREGLLWYMSSMVLGAWIFATFLSYMLGAWAIALFHKK